MELKQSYSQTGVEQVPEDWSVISMAKHASLKARIGWQALTTEEYLNSGTYYLVTGTDFVGGRVNWHTCHFVDEWRYNQDRNIQLHNGDVLLTKDGTIGKVGYVENLHSPATLNSGVFVIRPLQQAFYPLFLFYVLTSEAFDEFISKITAGSTITHLYQKDFVTFEFSAPSIEEQRAIATVLSDVDALLVAQNKLIAKKRDIKQATMQRLLTGKQRLPGFAGKWEVKRLGDVASITRGASPRPIESPIWFDEHSTVGWVRISDVTKSNMFLRETSQRLSALGVKNSRPVSRGGLIMSICATVGKPVITEIDTCIHDGFVVFYALQLNQRFLYYSLKFIESSWGKHGQIGSQMNLNTELINRTEISLPIDEEEQTAIATMLFDMDAELAVLEQQRDKTRALKQGMMQELLTGRIRLI